MDKQELMEADGGPHGHCHRRYGEGYVRIALVENRERLRQAVRNIKRFMAKSAAA